MASTKQGKLERYRDYAQYFTMGMAIVYAVYWAVLTITNTNQTGGVHTLGDVLLVVLVVGGLVMGLLYAVHPDKRK